MITQRPDLTLSAAPHRSPEWWGNADSGLTPVAAPIVRWTLDMGIADETSLFLWTCAKWGALGYLLLNLFGFVR